MPWGLWLLPPPSLGKAFSGDDGGHTAQTAGHAAASQPTIS